MRVLIAVSQDSEIGGVASVIRNLAQHLENQGHEIYFLHPAATIFLRKKITNLGFPGFDLRLQSPFGERHPAISLLAFMVLFPIGICQLIGLILRYRIQIINVHYPDDDWVFYFAICKRILSLGLITSIHGADVFPVGRRRAHYSWAIRFLLRSSNVIVAPSRWLQQKFLSVFSELSDKTKFIHNGINVTELNGLCARTNGFNHPPYILCVSAYKEQKAIDVLVRAFKIVQEIDPSLKLIVVGGGHLRGQLQDLAASLGIRDRIEFLGPKSRGEVVKLLFGCKAFVLPSRFETFGIAILEAMACQRPVVATTAGGIPEIIENGENGILVEPDNPNALAKALITLLKDAKMQHEIATNGYTVAQERFHSEKTGSAYEACAQALMSNPTSI